MRGLVIALALAAASPAQAQQTATASQAAGEVVARGLEAQYQAALIGERRLADDRETRLIADYERQLRSARARFDQGVAGAQAELTRARVQYADLVSQIALRDAASRAEIEAYRAEAQGLAQRASPELLEAYQRFADGDRLGAWPVIEALTQAQVRATMAAAGARAAVSVRDAGQARETMRLYGEASAADVLALWDQAAALDPRDFWTQVFRRRLAFTLNDLGRAEAAGRAALAAAGDPRERSVALNELGDVLRARNDLDGALGAYRESLEIRRRLALADLSNAERARDVSVSLNKVGDVLRARNDLAGALGAYRESLEIRRRLALADPSNAERARDVSVSLNKVGDVAVARNDLDGALGAYREGLEIARRLALADPSNAERARDVSVSLDRVGDVAVARNDLAGALGAYRESLEIRRRLALADPSNAERARDVSVSLEKLARIPGSGISWADVVAFMDEMDRRGQISPGDLSFLEDFRARAAAEGGR